jgi:hypothetical protein
MTAFQQHLITKHALQPQQQQQLNLGNLQNGVGIKEEEEYGEPMTKKAKKEEEEKSKMRNRGGQR